MADRAKALTGVDDHSRFCVSAYLMLRESSQRVCEGLALAMRTYGVPEEILTDNGKVFTGRFNRPPVEVLFDRVCRENGIKHRLTQPRSPDHDREDRAVPPGAAHRVPHRPGLQDLRAAQAELDEWVGDYNTSRPHQAIGHGHPGQQVLARAAGLGGRPGAAICHGPSASGWPTSGTAPTASGSPAGPAAVGVVCVNWQQVCLGAAAAGRPHRRLGHRRGPAVLRRRHPAAHREPHQHRGGQEEASTDPRRRDVESKRVSRINRSRSVTHQPKVLSGSNTPPTCRNAGEGIGILLVATPRGSAGSRI